MLKRVLIFVAAALLFLLGIGILAVLLTIPTSNEKKAMDKIRLEETNLSQKLDIVVIQSGYRKKFTGERNIYVPSLLVRATNISDLTSDAVNLTVAFLKNHRTLCTARSTVPALKPGEYWEIWLKCIDFVGFGSVAWGLTLAETTEGLDYVISLSSGRASIVIVKDKLRAKFF
jgi:hypothetical protein